MVITYEGRKITAVKRRVEGFPGVEVRINGQHVVTYGPMSSTSLRTIEGAIEQTKRDIDFCDAKSEPAFESFWYRKGDPRAKGESLPSAVSR